jgi:hypothetical protein
MHHMTRLQVAKSLGFQLAWLTCALGASQGLAWPGLLACGLLILYHITASANRWQAAWPCIAMGAMGIVAETTLMRTGLVTYAAQWPFPAIAPLWLLSLWAAFGTLADVVRTLLGDRRYGRYAIIGLAAGPLSYAAGSALGALSLSEPYWPGYLSIALIWCLAMPAMMAFPSAHEK